MTATSTTPRNSTTNVTIPEAVQKAGDQLISTVKQGQSVTLDAARAVAKATSTIPTPNLPKVDGAPELPDLQALTAYSFDLAIELLTAQRDFAVNLATAFAPAKSV